MARQILFVFILLYLCVNSIKSDEENFSKKTLHVYKDTPTNSGGKRTLVFNANDEDLSHHDRYRRDAIKPDKPIITGNISVKANVLNDTHKQLMVHWVGEQTDIIICLARDPKPHFQAVFPQVYPSAVYISYDYGDTYENKTDNFKTANGTYASVDKFYNHQKYNTHFVFTDTKNKLLFTTTNHGRSIKRIELSFEPSDVSFHGNHPNTFIVLDKNDPQKRLWLTEDFGVNWRVIQQYVSSFFWYDGDLDSETDALELYVQRAEPSGLSTIITSNNLFKTNVQQVFAENVKDFQIKKDFIFITKRSKPNNFDLYISYKGGELMQSVFASELNRLEYHIADVTGTRVMVAVSHSDKMSHLYVSEGLGNGKSIQFSLSLEGVFCYFPNSTWRDSWLHHLSEEAFADVYKVESLTGIYIASQVIQKPPLPNIGPQHLISLITYDHGGTWQPIRAPKTDNEGQPINCTNDNNCSLHLSQKFSQLYPDTRTASIMSSKSAPGVIMATGVVGKSLKGHYAVYVSTDAGITWREAIKDFCFFNMGDHGGILVAVKYYKNKGETRHVMYSTDEGEKWIEQEFHNEDLRLYGLMTEPGENTSIFTMFGSTPGEHKWIIVKLDLKSVFSYNCKPEDYKLWSPSQSDGHRLVPCVMGKQETYQRRIPHTNCFNGINYDAPVKLEPCVCDAEDYECDFGFVRSGRPSHCIKNKSISFDPYAIPKTCESGQFYNRTKGYRKIDGDVCFNGFSYLYLPDSLPCPIKETEEFLIVAQRERINRVNLQNNELVEIPVHGLRNVIAIDFDLKNNCLYWADIVADTIGRQCYSNGTNYPEILVESSLASIEGMAFDWISNILFFVDGMRARIEIIRTDIKHMGRMRKTIIGPEKLKKPRGIAVHPKSGYIFWTDWAPLDPSVSRANMDGTNIKKLFSKPVVEWPNGISIDHIAERIYFVDAREDYIASSDLDGKRFKIILKHDDRVSHPFAVAVFKDLMYWDDWKRNGIFSADKDHGVGIEGIKEGLPGLMDLKVFAHSIQEGTNPCSNKTICDYICLGAPQGKHVCLCPDGMNLINGKCMCPGNIQPNKNLTCPQIASTCSEEHFTCKNSLCVPKLWRCDGEDDCGDNSDETNCSPSTCTPSMFTCGDGKCIPQYWKCDFENDCADKSDEKNCQNKNCTGSQFTCKNGRCIPSRWKCDLQNDCGDGSDEEDCATNEPTTCKETEFKCLNGDLRCIPSHWRCDGEKDCSDGSDESNCTTNTCADWQFQCSEKLCIYKVWMCDGDFDCPDHSDEVNCTHVTPPPSTPNIPFKSNNNTCHDWMFTCGNKKCIPFWWKCDNVNDCGDSTDEIGCGPLNVTTTETPHKPALPPVCVNNQFQCFTGTCIPTAWVCDGSNDCISGEDELNCENHKNCTEDQFKCKIDGSCVALSAVCNKKYDCPDGSDEFCNDNHPQTTVNISCSTGYHPCDSNRCIPLSWFCDGKQDCYDGLDENECNKTERVYQVLQMGVDERGINATSLLLYWWIPIPQNIRFEFMPSISKRQNGASWKNYTWIDHSEFRFTSLDPYTEYNMTVFVRVKGSDRGSIPAKYLTATTGEGIPSVPLSLTVEQRNGSHVFVKWSPPSVPNGEIIDYEVCWAPPIPPIKQMLHSNKTYHLVTADFQPDIDYSFWVIAHNHNHESNSSEVSKLKFDGDSNIDIINDLKESYHTNSSVSLTWHAVKGADGYNITPEVSAPFPQLVALTTKTNSIAIKDLSPGTYYTFKVRAFKKTYVGQEKIISVLTSGVTLPEVPNLQGQLFKESGTSVKLSWDPPKDPRKVKWEFGIYYALNAQDLFRQTPVTTTNFTAIVQDLQACEEYIFSVGVVGPLGKGPLSKNTPLVMTHLNRRAPPKHVTVTQDGLDPMGMLVQWAASCSALQTKIGYIVSIYDDTMNKTMKFSVNDTTSSEMNKSFKINWGGVYTVTVSTYVPDAIPSKPVIFRAPPILPPHQLKVIPSSNGSCYIFWQEKDMPESLKNDIKYRYVILVNEGNQTNESIAQKYEVNSTEFVLNNVTPGEIYSFGVYLQTEDGYRSLLSEVVSIEIPSGTWAAMITQSSVVSIVVPLLLVLLVLASVLVFFVVKHRRLHQSFVRFASSHYDTRSGATTFGGDVLGEDDSPNIRGFSDDEPLVIA